MDFLKGKNRLGLYLLLLAVLAVGALAAVWSVTGTGAYLTGEGDWQTLAGDYRIGTIDYTVRVNDELLLGRAEGGESLKQYQLAVPLLGGVKMFDTLDPLIRTREFNEGATLMGVRVANYSKNMVDVTAQFALTSQTGAGIPPIRALPLPTTLTRTTAATMDYRTYILDFLTPHNNGVAPANLTELNSAYANYLASINNGKMLMQMGLLPGSVSLDPGAGDVVQDGTVWCYYRDVFFVVWTEYGAGEYNQALLPANTTAPTRQGQFNAIFTVGQLD